MADEQQTALGQSAEAKGAEGQAQTPTATLSPKPEVTQAADVEKIKAELREQIASDLKKQMAQDAEQTRRRLQSEADRKMREVEERAQARLKAADTAVEKILRDSGADENVIRKAREEELPTAVKLADYDRLVQAENYRAQAQAEEQAAAAWIAKVGLKREDFGADEWGAGMSFPEWRDTVALPKLLAKERTKAVEEAIKQVKAEQSHAEELAASGATVVSTTSAPPPTEKIDPKKILKQPASIKDAYKHTYPDVKL